MIQREIVRVEERRAFLDDKETWIATLVCGHEAELSGPPSPAPRGPRYIDCDECERDQA